MYKLDLKKSYNSHANNLPVLFGSQECHPSSVFFSWFDLITNLNRIATKKKKKQKSYFLLYYIWRFWFHITFPTFLWQWHTCGGWVGVKCISFKPGTYLCTPLFLKWKWLSLFLGCKQKCGAQYHKTLKTLFSSLKLEWMNFVY